MKISWLVRIVDVGHPSRVDVLQGAAGKGYLIKQSGWSSKGPAKGKTAFECVVTARP
jgi:hypothetical protein